MEKNTSKSEVIINFVWSELPCWTKQHGDTNNTWLEEMCRLGTGNTKLNLLCTASAYWVLSTVSKWRIQFVDCGPVCSCSLFKSWIKKKKKVELTTVSKQKCLLLWSNHLASSWVWMSLKSAPRPELGGGKVHLFHLL